MVFFLLLLLVPFWLVGAPVPIPAPQMVEIAVEHASTPEELAWGLMQRPHLPRNAGMLFSYPDDKLRSFWMFNTLIDLSVAFIDKNHVIREIYEMKAYPRMIDSWHPIRSVNDLEHIPYNDPALLFFARRKTDSQYPARYALEMNKSWYKDHNIQVGDVLIWETNYPKALIIKSYDISSFLHSEDKTPILELPEKSPIALWLPEEELDQQVVFLDAEGIPEQTSLIKGGKTLPPALKPVVHVSRPVKYLMLLPEKLTLK